MLSAKNIYKKYAHEVLRGVTIEVTPGEMVGIAGKNGSGKSTLLSILTGSLAPDAGQVTLNAKQIGYVPQETALFDNLSVRDNLRFWAAAYGIKGDAVNVLDFDNDFLKKRVNQLSGGMKKRLSIALALRHNPKWLIMDEPTSALDIGFKGMLRKMLEDIKNTGVGVVFTTHQPDELLWCDRVYILDDGVFVYEGDSKGSNRDITEVLYAATSNNDGA